MVLKMAGILLSPTRAIIDFWKNHKAPNVSQKTARLKIWSFVWFCIDVFVVSAMSIGQMFTSRWQCFGWVLYFVIYVALSRVNEIAYAFYNDARRVMRGAHPSTSLLSENRLIMAMRSYWALVVNFALLYYAIPRLFGAANGGHCLFRIRDVCSSFDFLDALYYSGATIATIGYGDLVPAHAVTKLLALYEVFVGMLIVVVAVSSYLATLPKGECASLDGSKEVACCVQ